VLQDLVSARGDILGLARDLQRFPGWDVEPLVTLEAADLISILDRFLRGDLSADHVGIWADALEMRDDVEFGDDAETGVVTAVLQLSNEVIGDRPVTPRRARELIAELETPPDPEEVRRVHAQREEALALATGPPMPPWVLVPVIAGCWGVALLVVGVFIYWVVQAFA